MAFMPKNYYFKKQGDFFGNRETQNKESPCQKGRVDSSVIGRFTLSYTMLLSETILTHWTSSPGFWAPVPPPYIYIYISLQRA